jgi:O-acetyl-ADP-ribose deacetylase (regulator of RNase III)
LRCQKIIHAVGPVYTDGEHQEAELLHEAVMHSLLMAEAEQLSSISLPAISSGIFVRLLSHTPPHASIDSLLSPFFRQGFPKDMCATLMFDAAMQFLKQRPTTVVKEIRFCNFDSPTVQVFVAEFDQRFPED